MSRASMLGYADRSDQEIDALGDATPPEADCPHDWVENAAGEKVCDFCGITQPHAARGWEVKP